MYIFISYSSKNTDEATNICNMLENAGQSCFLAYRDIVGGSVYAEELVNAIEKSDVVLLLLSEGSNNSPHILREVERSCSKNIPIVVYKLEDVVLTKSLEYFLMTHQWVTKEEGDERLIGVFKNLEKRKSGSIKDTSAPDTTAGVPVKTKKENRFKVNKALCFGIVAAVLVLIAAVVLTKTLSNRKTTVADDNTVKTEQAASSDISESVRAMKPGDIITIGSYRGEPIEWVALHRNDDGSTILISKDILSLKMFDAPESGEFGTCVDESLLNGEDALTGTYWTGDIAEKYGDEALIEAYGNNDWSVSDIRCWLNADRNMVSYDDDTDGDTSGSEKNLFYNDEKGFLKNFTDEEKNSFTEYTYVYENSLTGAKTELSDRVFLLSEDELEWFFAGDISPLAEVSEGALEDDVEKMYENYNRNGCFSWWLRDGSKETACMNRCVNSSRDELVFEYLSGYYGYGGIRPCICIK